jgi:hypothetical protein
MHVEQVLGDVPRDERCRCAEKTSTKHAAPKEQVPFWHKLMR